MKRPARKAYRSDRTDAEWALAVPYLMLMDSAAPQRKYPLRDAYDALRWMACNGATGRGMPGDFPSGTAG